MSGLYKVERIVARRKGERNQLEYKVKWVGYPESQCTWEPTKNLRTVIEMVEEFDKKCERKAEEGRSEHKDSKDAKDQKEQKEQKEREKQLRQKQLKEAKQQREAKELREAEEQQKRDKKAREEERKIEATSVEKKQTRNGSRSTPKQATLDASEEQPKPRNGKRNIRDFDQQGLIPTKRAKPEDTEDGSEQISEDRMQHLMQKIMEASGGENNKKIRILDISKNSIGELIYLTADEKGLRSYKSRSYMVKNHSQILIDFYESKIQFVKATPTSSAQ